MDGSVIAAALEGFSLVFSWPWILYPVAGTLLAMVFSASPGLNSSSLMALALPVTFAWDPVAMMLLYGAFVGGATFMGSVTAILFNIPGKTQNAVTLLDGFPLTQQGQARTAIGCAAAASALGSTFGVAVLILLIPVMRAAALALGPAEVLVLTLWGLSLLAAVSGNSLVKGLAAGGLGLGLSLVGHDPRTAEPRFTFGLDYLADGVSLVPAFLGLFALAEVLDLAASGRRTLSGQPRGVALGGSAIAGMRSLLRYPGLFLRSASIGTVIGAIPGIGSSVAGFIAYGHARQSARNRDRFGQGDIRGVLAPEAANDAKDGGALVPTLALGIPGGTGTAVLLGALSVHGLTPGRELMTTQLPLVFVLIGSLFLSNWLTSLFGLALVRPMARLSQLRTDRLVPVILVLAVLGCIQYRGLFTDVFVAAGFGMLGFAMKRLDWPRVPLVIGLTLGPLLETNLHLVMQLQALDRIDFWSRPVVLGVLALIAVNLLLPLGLGSFRRLRARWKATR